MRLTTSSLLLTSCVAGVSLAGPITPPPGPVAGTGKTLVEVEPRTAIDLANTPGDGNSLYRITQPGSYYLAGNVSGVSGKHGIEIAASHVAIDLNGFALLGVAGSLDGIATDGVRDALVVRGGTVGGWGTDGIDLTNGGAGYGSLIESVVSRVNQERGIVAGGSAVVRGCVAYDNNGGGIFLADDGVVESCTARQNESNAIHTGSGGVVTGCSVRNTGGWGIVVGVGSTVEGCSVSGSSTDGIKVAGRCLVLNNMCDSNGFPDTGWAGILCEGSDSRVEGNNCTGNDYGIRATGSGNFIARNTCSGSHSSNWSVAANNKCLVVNGVNGGAFTGNSGGVSPGSTDPNANYSY